MRRIIVAICIVVSAIVSASVSAQSLADEQQRAAAAERRAEIEFLRSQLEQARARLEAAARDLASRTVPAMTSVNGSNAGEIVLIEEGASSRPAPLGAVLVDAEGGALVTDVVPGSGASDAGIKVGDLIQAIDGFELSGGGSPSAQILERLTESGPGESVMLAVERGGDVLEYDVEIVDGPWIIRSQSLNDRYVRLSDRLNRIATERAEGSGPSRGAVVLGDPRTEVYTLAHLRSLDLAASAWGEMELVPMTNGLARYFGTDEGLLVIRSPSDESIGIEDGDVILAIGGRTPSSPEHAIRILSSFESGETIEFSIMREGLQVTAEYVIPQQSSRLGEFLNDVENGR